MWVALRSILVATVDPVAIPARGTLRGYRPAHRGGAPDLPRRTPGSRFPRPDEADLLCANGTPWWSFQAWWTPQAIRLLPAQSQYPAAAGGTSTDCPSSDTCWNTRPCDLPWPLLSDLCSQGSFPGSRGSRGPASSLQRPWLPGGRGPGGPSRPSKLLPPGVQLCLPPQPCCDRALAKA